MPSPDDIRLARKQAGLTQEIKMNNMWEQAKLIAEMASCLEEIMGMEYMSAFSPDTVDAETYFGERLSNQIKEAISKAGAE